jgi:hypothetical protein
MFVPPIVFFFKNNCQRFTQLKLHPVIREECKESSKCASLAKHFEHCQEKVHAGQGFKHEDCVEELYVFFARFFKKSNMPLDVSVSVSSKRLTQLCPSLSTFPSPVRHFHTSSFKNRA